MTEHSEHNNLDQFFQSRLSKDDAAQESWNNPPDAVFDSAMQVLNARNNENKKRFFWIFIVLGFGLFGSYIVWSQFQIQKLKGQIHTLSTDLNHKQQDQRLEASGSDNSKQDIQAIQDKTANQNSIADAENQPSALRNTLYYSPPLEVESSEPLIQTPDYESDLQIERALTIEEVESEKDLKIEEPEALNDTLLTTIKNPDKDSIVQTNIKWQWHAFAGVNWTSLSMTAAIPLGDNLKEYDNWYLGYQYGIGFSKQIKLSPWELNTTLSHTLARNKSVFKHNPVYDESMESTNSQGQTVYQTMYGFASPIGAYSQEISFNPNGTMSEGEEMESVMSMKNQFKIWSLHLGTSYRIIDNEHWNLSLNASLAANYIFDANQNLSYQLINEGQVLDQFKSNFDELNELNSVYPSYQLGAGIEYKFTRLGLGLNPSFGQSLLSIRSVDPTTEVKTKLSYTAVSFAINWRIQKN